MLELRKYQIEAIDAVFDYWARGGGSPLVEMATGCGKSLIAAELVRRLLREYPGMRVLCLVHVRELVRQNVEALLKQWPAAPVGINSAGLGRRDKRSPILFASIQSVAKESADTLGPRDLVLVDEAHLLPRSGDGQYRSLLARLREAVPEMRVAGFTATPYRLDSGRLDGGNDALFDETVFSYDIGRGVDEEYLSPLVSRATGQVIDVSSVKRAGGEFVARDLELAVNVDAITQAACGEIVEQGADRKSWLVFCTGVAHAEAVRNTLRARRVTCEMVTGETPKGERDAIFTAFKAGRIRALTGVDVFSVGFDAPGVDLIAMLRPTLSTSKYVQQCGRGTRLASGKSSCLVLDFALNVQRHGCVDAIHVGDKRTGDTTGKVSVDSVRAKECPNCSTLVAVQTMTCIHCGHEWPRDNTPKHFARADRDTPIMTREIADKWLQVTSIDCRRHEKTGSPPSLRVDYFVGTVAYAEWITIEHPGFPGAKAAKWWRSVVGTPVPSTVDQALARLEDEAVILAITVQRDGKYWRIVKRRVRRPDARIVEVDEKLNIKPVALSIVKEAV